MPPAAEPGGTRRPFSASAEGSAASPALIQAHTPVPRNPFVFPAENMAASAMVFSVQKIGIPPPRPERARPRLPAPLRCLSPLPAQSPPRARLGRTPGRASPFSPPPVS